MKIQPITANAYRNAANFKGYFAKYESYSEEVEGASARHGHSITAPNRSTHYVDYNYSFPAKQSTYNFLRRFSGHDDPNCYIEFLEKPKNEYGVELRDKYVYFADPQEGITDAIKAKSSYIVYDPEPSYPHIDKEVSKAYFEGTYEDYSQHYNTVKKYFERLENVDSKTLLEIQNRHDIPDKASKIEYYQGRIKDAIAQQKNADDCMKVYAESEKLRSELKSLFYKHHTFLGKLREISQSIEYPTYQDKKLLAEKKQVLESYKADFELLKNEISRKQVEIAPYFEKLKNLYVTRGIKVIKHI